MEWTQLFQKGCNSLFDWGPGTLIAALILYGIYKILLKLGRDVGVKIVGALEKPAEALNKQAESMDHLTGAIEKFMSIDRYEHREMIVLLKVIAGRLKHVEEGEDAGG